MAEKVAELEKTLRTHEKRILALEKILLSQETKTQQAKSSDENDFKGLIGGIRFLISKGFLNDPKSVKEIQGELKKEGYHYGEKSVSKILIIDLMQKRKIITRVEEDNVWKYVLRK
jgi:hypothetical protein